MSKDTKHLELSAQQKKQMEEAIGDFQSEMADIIKVSELSSLDVGISYSCGKYITRVNFSRVREGAMTFANGGLENTNTNKAVKSK